EDVPITTTTKNALITTQLGPCDIYPHRVKVSIVGVGKIGIACAIAILMRRMASEICLIDHDANKASAEAEDIQHVGVFLGCPLVTGTSSTHMKSETCFAISNVIYAPEKETQSTKGMTNGPCISIVHGLLAAKEPAVEKLSPSRGNSFRVSADVPLINPACDRSNSRNSRSKDRETDEV
ncbi:unnamed protein product, partial [Heterotrigona itama]